MKETKVKERFVGSDGAGPLILSRGYHDPVAISNDDARNSSFRLSLLTSVRFCNFASPIFHFRSN